MGVRAEETIDESTPARAIASLTDPKKLATLKDEQAVNARFQRCLYYLLQLTRISEPPVVIDEAMELNKTAGTAYAKAVKRALIGGLFSYQLFGYTSEGLQEMKQGKSATITKGAYAGQEAIADHIIPLSVCPELRNQMFNLQLFPASVISPKFNSVGVSTIESALMHNKDGLLSDEGLELVKRAYKKELRSDREKIPDAGTTPIDETDFEVKLARAERDGAGAVFEVWVMRLKKLAEQANKSKATTDVLIFEKTLNSAMSVWERMFEENWNKNHPRQGADDDILKQRAYERQRTQEVANLESFLDESLGAK